MSRITSQVRRLDNIATLLNCKNRKDWNPNCETSYTNFELLEFMESRSPEYICPTPPEPKGPYGEKAHALLRTVKDSVDREDMDLVCSTAKTSDSHEKKREY